MSARHAAVRLAELWPRLPVLIGPDWLELRPRFVDGIGALATADGDRAEHAERLLALAEELPALQALLEPADGECVPESTREPAWQDVAVALLAADPAGQFDRTLHAVTEALGPYADGRRITDTLLAAGIATALGLDANAFSEPEEWTESGHLGKRSSILGGSAPRLVPWADPLPWFRERPDEAQWVSDTWQIAVGDRSGIRLLLTDGTGVNTETAAVLSLGTGVASVLHRTEATDAREVPRWSWPLRLAILPGAGPAARLRSVLLAAAETNAGLITPVAASGRWSRTSLLLVPHTGGGDVVHSPGQPQATAVVVVSESPELVPPPEELRSLATRHRAAIAAMAHTGPSPQRWLNILLDRLSQDLPLDMALYGAAQECGALPPVIGADPRFLDATRIRPVLAAVPPDALRPSEEARVGRALRGGPGPDGTGLTPEAAGDLRAIADRARRVPARYVRADVVGPDGAIPAPYIAPHLAFHVRVFLAANARVDSEEPPFPADALPPGRTHRLTVLATDLTPVPGPDRTAAQEIELSGDGDSTSAVLRFSAGAPGTDVLIRIAVLYGSRVLQTGVLSGRVGAQEPPKFRVESVIRARTDELDLAQPHDATLLVGHTANGLPLVTTRTEEFLHRSTSHDLRRTLQVLLAGLKALVNGADRFGGYGNPEFATLLTELARRGRRLRKTLFPDGWETDGLVQQLRRAHSISVYSAGPEAILPIELLYDRELDTGPGRSLRLCPHAPSRVDDDGCEGCPERDEQSTVCPFGFWGTSKVIERHVRRESDDARFALGVSPDIDWHACSLTPVCAAASARADDNDDRAWTTAAAALTDGDPEAVRLAADWADLNTLVRKMRDLNTPPGVVLLFPHSSENADGVVFLTLGESDEVDVIDGMEFLFARDGGTEPVILLLGCATADGPTPFSNASTALLDDGAPGVVATAVPVLGQHIVPVGVRLLTELRAAASGTSGSPLGEALLRARRKLLTSGDACVLALVGFGDTDWVVRARNASRTAEEGTP
ncbi:hypothetical protein [Streptomyces sp. NPDC019890]|uniref:hypothetical protein n=1 Tax=Streptomyces sp. NPDC019890 TaxID=3365064 RepID=UPI00384D7112